MQTDLNATQKNPERCYTVYHLHTDLSNGVTNIDSVTKYHHYIEQAKKEGMKAIAFSEHGSVFNWLKKKEACEAAGLKYIHGVEMYLTKDLKEKIRDNYHIGLYAKNWDGVQEINKMVSKAFNRQDGHFYFMPRITFDELLQTSENIIITTACIGGVLARQNQAGDLTDENSLFSRYLNFLIENKDRCFLEIQHHQDIKQVEYNKMLKNFSEIHGIRLIAGTDTHALNETHSKGRTILQKSKDIFFSDEEGWDITWKTYDELVKLFQSQCINGKRIFNDEEIIEAIENTNVLADMVEEFEMDRSYKYPKMSDDPMTTLKRKVWKGIVEKGINKYPNFESEYIPRIKHELEVYEHNGAFDFLLLDEKIKSAARENGKYCGPSRGSVSGSIVAYLTGITEIDSIKNKLNFNRFMSLERVSLADIDTDWAPDDREWVKDYIFNLAGLYCSEIITFNTVALKGSIRDVCRALYTGEVPEELLRKYDEECRHYGRPTDATAKRVDEFRNGKYINISNYICSNIETNEKQMRQEYPEVFEYVDIVNGTVVSVGCHPCGIIVSPIELETNVGLFTTSTSDKPVSMLNMKEVDSLNFVKLDVLGLDNIGIINETCKLANIPRVTPDTISYDENVWKSIKEDTTGIFQFESDLGFKQLEVSLSDETIEKIRAVNPDFQYLDIMSMANGAIRPAGASYREALSRGEFKDNGHPALNAFLAPTLGFLVYQEQIIEFLHSFCGYTMGEADIVRRAFSKKTGTEIHIPNIKAGFVKTMTEKYNCTIEQAHKIIEDFLIVIRDASEYLFSLNHSMPYSYIGYACGYLRHYYPLEFLTATFNVNKGNTEKTAKISEYAKSKGINVLRPTYGKSKAAYFFDKNSNTIYKGVESIKYLNADVANELYEFSKCNPNASFVEILRNCSANSKQIDVLVKLGYFRQFGTTKKLLSIIKINKEVFGKKQFKKDKFDENLIRQFAKTETEKMFKDVDTQALCNYLASQIPDDELPVNELVKYELEFTGDVTLTDNTQDNRNCVVLDVNTKYTPVVTLYKLKTGEKVKAKVQKKFYKEKPVQQFESLYVATAQPRNKKRLVNGEWITLDEYDLYITYYKM